MFDWLDILLFAVGGFGLGYGLAARGERERTKRHITTLDRLNKLTWTWRRTDSK
jgi:hypothetical protein